MARKGHLILTPIIFCKTYQYLLFSVNNCTIASLHMIFSSFCCYLEHERKQCALMMKINNCIATFLNTTLLECSRWRMHFKCYFCKGYQNLLVSLNKCIITFHNMNVSIFSCHLSMNNNYVPKWRRLTNSYILRQCFSSIFKMAHIHRVSKKTHVYFYSCFWYNFLCFSEGQIVCLPKWHDSCTGWKCGVELSSNRCSTTSDHVA